MDNKFYRGKQQILYNFLPGRVFDYGNKSSIAIVKSVEGENYDGINKEIIVNKVWEHARSWTEENRPGLLYRTFQDLSMFSIIDPKLVKSELYPLVFYCENNQCSHIVDMTVNGVPHDNTCPKCKQKKLTQFRFIKAHQCGYIEPFKPPTCNKCKSNQSIALRGLLEFERFGNFQWICTKCKNDVKYFVGNCPNCSWEDSETGNKTLSILLFRANKQFYIHSTTLINIPKDEYSNLLKSSNWHIIVGAKYIDTEFFKDRKLKNVHTGIGNSDSRSTLDPHETVKIFEKVKRNEISIEEAQSIIQKMMDDPDASIQEHRNELIKMSGVDETFWHGLKFSILDSVIPNDIASKSSLRDTPNKNYEIAKINELGIEDIRLIDDFPIVTAAYGYSRLSYRQDESWLRSFEGTGEYKGKIPIYIDKVEADAFFINLKYDRVINWLRANGINPDIPGGEDDKASQKGYFLKLFHELDTYRTLTDENKEARYVMNLLHTISHLSIRRAELLCGLERTSISEYIVPSTLTYAMYCNHRFGATIGALTSLYEQSLLEWLAMILDTRNCVYDPVCSRNLGTCHACTHLPETSCRHFNLNLGRVFLFGGEDLDSGNKIIGYFDDTYLR